MNERTHFFIKNIPLTLYSWKDWSWLCVIGELETGTDCYILTPSSSDHCSISFAFWLGCSTVGHWGLQADSHAVILSPTDSNCNWNWLELTQAVCGTWLYNCLTFTCFLWAYASATITEFNPSTGQGDIPISSIGCTCFAFFRLFSQGHLLIEG